MLPNGVLENLLGVLELLDLSIVQLLGFSNGKLDTQVLDLFAEFSLFGVKELGQLK